MGGSNSKRFNRNNKNDEVDGIVDRRIKNEPIRTAELMDRQYIEDIKKDLCENPEMFVLNNMLMAVMFFENYPRDITELSQQIKTQTNEQLYYPDVFLEKVSENVHYRTKHLDNKYYAEPIAPKRLFVLYDFIKVLGPMEEIEQIESSLVRSEESPQKGFTRLKEVVATWAPESNTILFENDSTPRSSRNSFNDDYNYFEDVKSSKNLEVFRTLDMQQNLPRTCIEHRKQKKLNLPTNTKFEHITENDLYDVVSYISSKGFMNHFHYNLFPILAEETLQFSEEVILKRRPIPGKIICKIKDEETAHTLEVIPAVPIKWPGEQTLEFIMKSQRCSSVRSKYVFPTPNMVGEIKKRGCYLVPKGCFAKDRNRRDIDLEWEYYFPQAEKYLTSFMNHAQMKCYLFLICIYKTYLAPITTQKGLLLEHIESFFIAQLDKNFTEWPEHKLGTKLLGLLKQLNTQIASSDIKNYFIDEKNSLGHVPKKYLRENQRILHDIIESPLMGCLKSLRNIIYVKGDEEFYPSVNFGELFDILVTKKLPQLSNLISMRPLSTSLSQSLEKLDGETIWSQANENVKREKKRKEREMEKQRELEEALEREKNPDSLDLSWMCEKQFDIQKKRAILKFFIDIFLKISKKSRRFSWDRQALMYLKQAKYLTILMQQECSALGVDVEEVMNTIHRQEPILMELVKNRNSTMYHNPGVPLRNAYSLQNLATPNGSIHGDKHPEHNALKTSRKTVAFTN